MDAYTVTDVSPDQLAALLQWGQMEAWTWLYGETQLAVTLAYLRDMLAESDGAAAWQQWSLARVFGPDSELAWWVQADGRYRLRLLHDKGALPPGVDWGTAEQWERWEKPTTTLLHGELDTGGSQESGQPSWSEARIPRYLYYPTAVDLDHITDEQTVRVALVTQPYAQQGIIGLTRLTAVQVQTMEAANV